MHKNRGKPKDSEKNLSQCHFIYNKSHWIYPGANPGRRDDRQATNRLSHGTALRAGYIESPGWNEIHPTF
jgi:hypothetical protein